ncbi:trypsin-like serine protease [Neoconidiobolus thromboides FSU 785]|nr:trypsin-like serine protease [Neoconidiobolus thromboides FSU 785]
MTTNNGLSDKSLKQDDARIIGGIEVTKNKFPWMVSISNSKREHFCGGTLIASDIVLSAGHCLSLNEICTQDVIVRVGYTNISNKTKDQGEDFKVIRRILHTDYAYTPSMIYSDLLILKLDRETKVKEFPTFATDKIDNMDSTQLFAMGWGRTDPKDEFSISDKLIQVELPLVTAKKCESMVKNIYNDFQSSIMLCAGGSKEKSQDACKGDSGGPLIGYDENNSPVLYGITSFGRECGKKGVPGLFTRISAYKEFIDWNMF